MIYVYIYYDASSLKNQEHFGTTPQRRINLLPYIIFSWNQRNNLPSNALNLSCILLGDFIHISQSIFSSKISFVVPILWDERLDSLKCELKEHFLKDCHCQEDKAWVYFIQIFYYVLKKSFTHNNCRGGKLFLPSLPGFLDDLIIKLTQDRLIEEKLNFNFVCMGAYRNMSVKVAKEGNFYIF